MSKRIHVGGAVISLLVAATVGTTISSSSAAETSERPTDATYVVGQPANERLGVKRKVTLVSSATQVDEGDRYVLTATIRSAATSSKVTLEKWKPSLYGWDDPKWEAVKTSRVNARRKVKFPVVAVDHNSERYRATVTYKKAKAAKSKPAAVTVWRWIPLSEYDPYYETGGAIFGTTTINGRAYTGWGAATYSHAGAWESRFTPGRTCTAFTGILGVGDISADGSSGTIAFTADDQTVYTSPTLTPGMALPVTIPLTTKPYRFGILLADTTPGGTTGRDVVESWPVIGAPAFKCTGV